MESGARQDGQEGVFEMIVSDLRYISGGGYRRVAVDGVDGSGKTHFAAELSRRLEEAGLPAVNVSVDGFHHPAGVRYQRGRESPEGFFFDSYDYSAFIGLVLEPFGETGDGEYVPAIHDTKTEAVLARQTRKARPGTILVADGIFLHRDELVDWWNYSVFLDVDFDVSIHRMGLRDGTPTDTGHRFNRRYVEGQRIYIETCAPATRATVVVDNTDLARPRLVRRRAIRRSK